MSSESSRIGTRIARLLGNEADRTGAAVVYGADLGYQCFPPPCSPDHVRRPDGSVVRMDRWRALVGDPGYLRIPADLAVEVVSPNELHRVVSVKVQEYLSAGFGCLWVAEPATRTILEFWADGSTYRRLPDQTISAGPVLPGFRYRVGDLFAPPGTPVVAVTD